MYKRGDIFFLDLGQHTDSRQSGFRPVILVSNDLANKYSPIVTVIPVTSKPKKQLPTHVLLPLYSTNALDRPCTALAEQILTVDKIALGERKGCVTDHAVMERITQAMKTQLSISPNGRLRVDCK